MGGERVKDLGIHDENRFVITEFQVRNYSEHGYVADIIFVLKLLYI